MNYTDIIRILIHQLDTKPASTFFINGAPGSGKTFLLNDLARNLPNEIPKLKVFGPYNARSDNTIGYQILNDFFNLGYFSMMPDQDITQDLNNTWLWLKNNLQTHLHQSFVVLIDLFDFKWDDYDTLRILFSSMRYLEHLWDSGSVRLVFIVAGFWDHPGLEQYYGKIQLSFPYTASQNYILWEEIPINDIVNFIEDINPEFPLPIVFGKLLHEISGGNPSVMQGIKQSVF